MTLVFTCVVLGYSLLFFGWELEGGSNEIFISPQIIVVIGLIIAAINGIASNILAEQLGKGLEKLSPFLKTGIPVIVFLFTIILSIFIALLSI
ncbi:MAG: hypothetical protein UZ14_CFX002000526 [Chloroflexi bacterium OLB14]|nr:MAG: hypothetical protein UZ14_CFX002000526 [Chloroflexi bacterium OLB14]